MRHKSHRLLFLIISVAVCLPSPIVFTQSSLKKRPELKQFGSSLKRMRWDPNLKEAVPTKAEVKTDITLNEGDVVYIHTTLVTSDILVVDDKGKLVQNLTPDDFLVTEDGQLQPVAYFHRGNDAARPRTIVLIMDYNGCHAPFLRRSVDAAKVMVDKLGSQDLMAIVTDDVEMIVNFTNDKNKLKKKLEWLWENHHMSLGALAGLGIDFKIGKGLTYSALMATLKEAFIEEDVRPIIIFQTDGAQLFSLRDAPVVNSDPQPDLPDDLREETQRRVEKWKKEALKQGPPKNPIEFSLADVYRALERSRATVYAVIPGFRLIDLTPRQQLSVMKKKTEFEMAMFENYYPTSDIVARKSLRDSYERRRAFSPPNLMWAAKWEIAKQDALATIAAKTGGWAEFLETPGDADGVYDRIMADINHRYIIGYYPANRLRDGARRKINVQVKGHPEYYVLGRSSYYAPAH